MFVFILLGCNAVNLIKLAVFEITNNKNLSLQQCRIGLGFQWDLSNIRLMMSGHCFCGRWPVPETILAAFRWILWEGRVSWHGNYLSLIVLYAIYTAFP